jgi:hypothetical protein
MSVEIHLWDALQSDGKPDGRNVALCSQRKIAVRSIFELTVNFECDVQHPCGFLGDRRVGRADGKFPRSQAIARTGASRFVCGSAPSNGMKGRGRDNLPVVDLCNYIINRNALRASIQPWRRSEMAGLGDLHPRAVRSPGSLGIECSQCDGQRSHVRARWPAGPGHFRSLVTGSLRATHVTVLAPSATARFSQEGGHTKAATRR